MTAESQSLERSYRDRVTGGLEQMVSSTVAMAGLILLSRIMTVDEFGMLAFASSVWLVFGMLQNAIVITPFIVSCPDPDQNPEECGFWLTWNLGFALFSAAVLGLLGAAFRQYLPWVGNGFLLSIPITVAGLVYMFARRVHYQRRSRRMLLGQASTYALVYGAGLTLLATSGWAPTSTAAGAALAAAYFLPGLLFSLSFACKIRLKPRSLLKRPQSGRLIVSLGLVGVLWEMSNSGVLIALAIAGTPADVAVYAITLTLVRPLMLFMSTLIDVELPRASRVLAFHNLPALTTLTRDVWLSLVVLCAVPAALLVMYPEFFLELLYGARYAGATWELQLRVAVLVPLVCIIPLEIALTTLRETRSLAVANLVGAFVAAATLAVYQITSGIDAAAALSSLLAARLTCLPMLYLRYRHLAKPAVDLASNRIEASHVR
jgi:O-antigen/teichoic acid export membrane protein